MQKIHGDPRYEGGGSIVLLEHVGMVIHKGGHEVRFWYFVDIALPCDAIPSTCNNILEQVGPNSLILAYSTLNHDALATPYTSQHDKLVSVASTPSTSHPHSAIQGGSAVLALVRGDFQCCQC